MLELGAQTPRKSRNDFTRAPEAKQSGERGVVESEDYPPLPTVASGARVPYRQAARLRVCVSDCHDLPSPVTRLRGRVKSLWLRCLGGWVLHERMLHERMWQRRGSVVMFGIR